MKFYGRAVTKYESVILIQIYIYYATQRKQKLEKLQPSI